MVCGCAGTTPIVGSSVFLSDQRNIALSSRFSSVPCPSVDESEKLTKKGRSPPLIVQDSVLIPDKVLIVKKVRSKGLTGADIRSFLTGCSAITTIPRDPHTLKNCPSKILWAGASQTPTTSHFVAPPPHEGVVGNDVIK